MKRPVSANRACRMSDPSVVGSTLSSVSTREDAGESACNINIMPDWAEIQASKSYERVRSISHNDGSTNLE